MRSILTFLLSLTLAGPALAVDGVLEINQTCAVNTGCFSGDTAGFPVTIDGSAGSSYILTGDLTVPDENTSGVLVSSSYITVDLGGHSVIGPVVCGGTPTVCSSSGTGRGVSTTAVNGVRIRNGTVRGFGDIGVGTNASGSIEDVASIGNAGIGIFVGPISTVDRSKAVANGGDGIAGANWVRISNSASVVNAGDGILVGNESIVSNNTVTQNEGRGIAAGDRSQISGNIVIAIGSRGITGDVDLTISNNTVDSSPSTTRGIVVSRGVITDNVVRGGMTGISGMGAITRNVVIGASFRGISLSQSGSFTNNHRLESNLVTDCETGVGISVSDTRIIYMRDNNLRDNEISLSIQNLGGGSAEIIAGGNLIVGRTADISGSHTFVPISCNRVGSTTVCPP